MRRPRWPWKPREYVAVLRALREAEESLDRLEEEATKQAAAQQDVRREISRRRRGRR